MTKKKNQEEHFQESQQQQSSKSGKTEGTEKETGTGNETEEQVRSSLQEAISVTDEERERLEEFGDEASSEFEEEQEGSFSVSGKLQANAVNVIVAFMLAYFVAGETEISEYKASDSAVKELGEALASLEEYYQYSMHPGIAILLTALGVFSIPAMKAIEKRSEQKEE